MPRRPRPLPVLPCDILDVSNQICCSASLASRLLGTYNGGVGEPTIDIPWLFEAEEVGGMLKQSDSESIEIRADRKMYL